MRRQFFTLLVVVLTACGGTAGSPDDSPPTSTQPPGPTTQPTSAETTTQPTSGETTAPTVSDTDGSTGQGRATLTLDGETFQFPSFTCLVGHEEAATLGSAYEDNSFVGYTGLVDGVQMRIWIYDMQGEGRLTPPAEGPSIQSGWWSEVQVDSVDDLSWTWIATNQLTADNLSLELDEARIIGSGTFGYWGDDEGEPAPGTFEAECG